MLWFGLIWCYDKLNIVNYLMPNPIYIYIYIIWFGLVWFYGISADVDYLMPNPVYRYMLKIYDLG